MGAEEVIHELCVGGWEGSWVHFPTSSFVGEVKVESGHCLGLDVPERQCLRSYLDTYFALAVPWKDLPSDTFFPTRSCSFDARSRVDWVRSVAGWNGSPVCAIANFAGVAKALPQASTPIFYARSFLQPNQCGMLRSESRWSLLTALQNQPELQPDWPSTVDGVPSTKDIHLSPSSACIYWIQGMIGRRGWSPSPRRYDLITFQKTPTIYAPLLH